MKNIYFVGKAGAGKTYLCEYLKREYGYTQAKMAFPVYMIAEKYFDMSKKDRVLLQTIGSDIGRDHVDPNLWVNRFAEDTYIARETAEKLGKTELKLCTDDVRFKNEHNVLRDEGWIGIYVYAPENVRSKRLTLRDGYVQDEFLNHPSEKDIDNFSDELIKLDSSGTVDESIRNLNLILRSEGII